MSKRRKRETQQQDAQALIALNMSTLAAPPPSELAADTSSSFAAKFWPELSVLLTLSWVCLTPAHWWRPNEGVLFSGIAMDAVLLMGSASLIDIASRIKRAPPLWVLPFAVLGLLMLSPGSGELLAHALSLDTVILLPFAWAIIERLRELWTLPQASVLEKIRRRTLVFDRLYVALLIGVLTMLFGALVYFIFAIDLTSWLGKAALLIVWLFYAVNCFNVWRVHQALYLRHPRSLLPWIDQNEASDLRPL
jgi:hypothetical protein